MMPHPPARSPRPVGRAIFPLLTVAALLLGAPAPAAAGPPPAPAAQSAVPRFEPDTCWFTLPAGETADTTVVCGWLVVLEEHAPVTATNGRPITLKLAVAVLKARAFRPQPEPIVFVPDQPGQAAIDASAVALLASPLRDQRDVIVYDPRGAGHSQPNLDCAEVRSETTTQLGENLALEEAAARYNVAALACRERLVQGGANLSAYNTLEQAADLDDLRRALGYTQLNLYGSGYGARVILNLLRSQPAGVRGAVLDSPLTPQNNLLSEAPATADAALTEFFAACEALARCAVWYRDLERTLANTVDILNARPAALTLTDPATGQTYPAQLTGDRLIEALLQMMARADALPLIPEIVRRTAARQYTPLENYLSATAFDRSRAAGAYWSAVCAEDGATQAGPPDVRDFRRWVQGQAVTIEAAYRLCGDWRVRSVLPAAGQPVTSSVPVLVLTGNFDPYTPAANGLLAAGSTTLLMGNFSFINSGHRSYPSSGECAVGLVEDFYETPGLALNSDCLATVPAVNWVIPSDVVDMPARSLLADLHGQQPRTLLWLGLLALSTLALLSGLVVFPLARLAQAKEKPLDLSAMPPAPTEIPTGMPAMPPPPDLSQAGAMLPNAAPWLAVILGLLLAALAVLLPYLVAPVLAAGAPVTWIGLPGSLAWYAALPAVELLLTILFIAAAGAGLFGQEWSRRRKLYLTLLVLAALAALALVIGAGGLLPAWVWLRSWIASSFGI
ncbi:MAG: alpha/beta fold hydrolase [Anaerolineales bacterium]|nr:alpha/beta fold hydrolase [Anaerolineales bacterium]